MIFWHAATGFKKAIQSRQWDMIDYLINTVNINLEHLMFDKILNYTIVWCQKDTLDEAKESVNDEIFKIIVAKKMPKIDEMDDTHENLTPLALCCFIGVWSIAKVLVELGADVNSVTETDMTPMGLCLLWKKEAEFKKDQPMMDAMDELVEYLRSKGGYLDWKKRV